VILSIQLCDDCLTEVINLYNFRKYIKLSHYSNNKIPVTVSASIDWHFKWSSSLSKMGYIGEYCMCVRPCMCVYCVWVFCVCVCVFSLCVIMRMRLRDRVYVCACICV
jgi:hypothetical protein